MVRVCFVCLGNICRSPTAEGVMRHLVQKRGLENQFVIDSAGTGGYHVGASPDRRSVAAAKARGIRVDGCARQFERRDFERFDYVLAMDAQNLADLKSMAPKHGGAHVALLLDYAADGPANASVPDPYYGGDTGFGHVLDLCERACEGFLASVIAQGLIKAPSK